MPPQNLCCPGCAQFVCKTGQTIDEQCSITATTTYMCQGEKLPFQFGSAMSYFGLQWTPFNMLFWFRLPPATKAPRGRPSPHRRAEENEKKEAETGGSG